MSFAECGVYYNPVNENPDLYLFSFEVYRLTCYCFLIPAKPNLSVLFNYDEYSCLF